MTGQKRRRSPSPVMQPDIEGVEVRFVIPDEPATKRRHRMAVFRGKVHTYSDPKMVQAQRRVSALYRQARGPGEPGTKGFGVAMDFYVGSRQRRDVDNYVKLILDGLTKYAWVDDSQVTEISAKVHHGSQDPRSEVHVYPTLDLPDYMSRDCEHCRQSFRLYDSWSSRRFCSRICMSAALKARRARVCEHCAIEFHPKSPQRWCSVACKSKALSITAPCQGCGVEVHRPKSQIKGEFWCTPDCRNTHKTHCPQGHEYTPENTYRDPSQGRRNCRTCRTEASRKRRERMREGATS